MPFSAREEGCHVRLCFAMVCFALCGCASHMHASLEWVVVHEAVQSPSGFNNPLRTFTKVLSYPCLFTVARLPHYSSGRASALTVSSPWNIHNLFPFLQVHSNTTFSVRPS